jgi:very-short-patch-repair endonuclease
MGPLLEQAKRMRRAPVFNERLLWRLLRDRRLAGMKFRRQVAIGPYIADFVCLRHRLIIEADGPLHDPDRDLVRDAWFRSNAFHVLRFANSQVSEYPDLVLDRICEVAGRLR